MKKIIYILILLVAQFSYSKDTFKTISINELDSLIKSSSKNIHIYDANVESTRTHVGIIPGAKFIDSSMDYDTASVLPKEKNSPLIFYCANPMCTSSHQAATRAIGAGYTDVSVLTEGIFGWKKAGKQLESINRKPQSVEASSVDPKEANKLVKEKKAVIVDVREQEERFEVIPMALWIPTSKVGNTQYWTEFKNKLQKNKTVIFYCASGFRSRQMAQKLSSEGFQSQYFKSADQWKAAGLPIEKGPAK